ncbi:MAG: Ku protein [Gemmataceae bacterium]
MNKLGTPTSAQTNSTSPIATSPSATRATWSGMLQFGLVAVPVKAYSVTRSAPSIHLNQLHADCGQRIRYEKHCPQHGKVDGAAIVSGYEYAAGQYVVIDEEEIEQLRTAQDKAVSLQQFISADEVDARLFAGRSYHLAPDGPAARRPYAVLNQAMVQRTRCALGRVALHGSRLLVLVRPTESLLVMHVLHFPEELRAAPTPQTDEAAITEEEGRLAGLLVDAASMSPNWSDYRDESAAELQNLIEAKVAGRPLPAPADEAVAVLPLLDALKQSVAALSFQLPVPKSPTTRRRSRKGDHCDERAVSAHAGNARRAL